MHLARVRRMGLGLLAVALVALSLAVLGRSPDSRSGASGSAARVPPCTTRVAEHAACALPPRRAVE